MEDPSDVEAIEAAVAGLLSVVVPAVLLLLWWAIGRRQERRHLADLARVLLVVDEQHPHARQRVFRQLDRLRARRRRQGLVLH